MEQPMESRKPAYMELNVFEKSHRENKSQMKGGQTAVEKDSKAKHFFEKAI